MGNRVLIVEDDDRLASMLHLHLAKLEYNVDVVNDGEEGLSRALACNYDLIILDRSLPGIEGLEVCRRVRRGNDVVRILILTALSDELEVVTGLETGADDYMGKPFRLSELVARVRALLRRGNSSSPTAGVVRNKVR